MGKVKIILCFSMTVLFSCSSIEPAILANTYTPLPLTNSPEDTTSIMANPTETEQVNSTTASPQIPTVTPVLAQETLPFLTHTPDLSYQTLAVEIATQMVTRPLGTPLPLCTVSITDDEILYFDEPFFNINQAQGTLSSGESYEILAWHPPTLYLGEDGIPKGWVPIPQIGVELSGAGCQLEGPVDLEDLYGFPNVCLFIAINGSDAPYLHREPLVDSEIIIMAPTGYYMDEKEGFYLVTISEAGPSGYVLKSSGQLVGDCP